ncbi:succinate--hydroxymethylglutarate CoA-transferase [Schistocerca nitens]|uniref:succinate--hydroxymethylglutarate CoA-transferase n=1 Tax=Schistocerca nitens TaxID=7011 RepID=UPI00211969B2|nr:succinate--hydroxymethylglutarate CoA-transferase [Schistocerca nitens]
MLFRIGNLIKTRIFLDQCNFVSLNCKKCYADVVTNKAGPLDGIRVLDLSRIIAGPFCTMILGDLGAEIIKIETPQIGDESRNWGPPFIKGTKESCYFLAVNRNKKSVCVDLKSPKGQKVIHDLAAKCDVLVENYVPGKLNEFNLDYDTIKHVAPKLIYCSITGYGSEGPYSKRPGYDVIAASVGGLMHITGPRGGEPCKVGVPMTDMATGLYAHGAIVAALFQRGRTGLGQKIDCDLLSTQVSCLINVAANNLNVGLEAERWGTSHSSIVPYESFPTSDGCYITIGAGSNQQFKELCEKLDLPHLVVDERFCNNEMRVKNRKILIETLRNRFKEKSLEEWCALLQDSSFPNGPINTISKVMADPHIKHINLIKEMEHPSGEKIRLVGPPVKFSDCRNEISLPPPCLGQHTSEVLKELLDYSDVEIQSLQNCGAIS